MDSEAQLRAKYRFPDVTVPDVTMPDTAASATTSEYSIAKYIGSATAAPSSKVAGATRKIEKYKNDKESAATKDGVISKLMPSVVSECSLISGRQDVCISSAVVAKVGNIIAGEVAAPIKTSDNKSIIDAAKSHLNCTTEKCVLKTLESKLGTDVVRRELIYMKIEGPTDTKLLSNYDIDHTLQSWQTKFPRFFPYNFNMLNYDKYSFRSGRVIPTPDTLHTISWADDLADRYNCCACVINTDTYQGSGKHWMALFADWRDPARATIEFFNSSGNSPASAWIKWMVRVKTEMELAFDKAARPVAAAATTTKPANEIVSSQTEKVGSAGKRRIVIGGRIDDDDLAMADLQDNLATANNFIGSSDDVPQLSPSYDDSSQSETPDDSLQGAAADISYPRIIKVCKIRQQQSRTECGVYSLFYIWSRLNGVPYSYFEETPVPDQLMFEFRQHLFEGPHNESGKKFDYDAYRARVNIKWE